MPKYYAGPYAAAFFDSFTDMPDAQRLTYIRLFHAAGDLWLKEQPKDPRIQNALFRRCLEAICLTELHFPALQADCKMHLAHVPPSGR